MDRQTLTKQYTNGEITVVWKPALCRHSTNCWNDKIGLGEVFNPRIKPWIQMGKSTTERIIAQVNLCPSGALSYFVNDCKES